MTPEIKQTLKTIDMLRKEMAELMDEAEQFYFKLGEVAEQLDPVKYGEAVMFANMAKGHACGIEALAKECERTLAYCHKYTTSPE